MKVKDIINVCLAISMAMLCTFLVLCIMYFAVGPSPSEVLYKEKQQSDQLTAVVYNPDILPLTECPECGCPHYNRIECPECNYEWWEGTEESDLNFNHRFEFLVDSLQLRTE